MESSLICEQFSDDLKKFEEWIKNQTELPKDMSKFNFKQR